MKKPFIDGSPATGRKFIGRKEYLKVLTDFIKYEDKGCMSVCGLPRIGKTSIVQKALKPKSKKILSVFVDLSNMTSFFDLWKTGNHCLSFFPVLARRTNRNVSV